MNTISSNSVANSMVQMATEGQTLYNTSNKKVSNNVQQTVTSASLVQSGSEVAQNIEQSAAEIKADTQQLQKMSDMIAGNKLQFSVNKELGSVIVTIVDANTEKVVKQIPSEEIVNLKLRIRKAIGNIFDEVI